MKSDALSTTFAALSDPTRRAVLARLAAGEATVGELAQPFAMSLPAISKHLKVLEGAGLISKGRNAQWRPCRLEAAPLRGVADWALQYRRFWTESFDRLDAYLGEIQAEAQPRAAGGPPPEIEAQVETHREGEPDGDGAGESDSP